MQIPARSGLGHRVLYRVNVTMSQGFYGHFTNVCFPHWTANSRSHIYQQGSGLARSPNLRVSSVGCQEAAHPLMDLPPRGLGARMEPARQRKQGKRYAAAEKDADLEYLNMG